MNNKTLSTPRTIKHYFIDLALVVMLTMGLYLIVAWSSYNPFDSAWSISSSQTEVSNKAGQLGAWIIDVLFTFFGQIAKIIPFVLFLIPIFLLKNQFSQRFRWKTVGLRSLGFILLLWGMSTLGVLFFNDTGIIGHITYDKSYLLLGKFGLIFGASLLSVLGFILCSGLSLLRLMTRLYYWLTESNTSTPVPPDTKNLPPEDLKPAVSSPHVPKIQGLKHPLPAVDYSHLMPIEPTSQSKTTLETHTKFNVATEKTEHSTAPLFSNPLDENINTGVKTENLEEVAPPSQLWENSLSHSTPTVETFSSSSMPVFEVHTESTLPKVHLNPTQTDIPTPKITSVAPLQTPDTAPLPQAIEPSTAVFSPQGNAPEIQTSSLQSGSNERETNSVPLTTVSETHALQDELAKEFALYEQQRRDNMEARANAMNEAETFEQIVQGTPNYKPYSDTFIHPLLQPKTIHQTAPSTPLPCVELLDQPVPQKHTITQQETLEISANIEKQLHNFGVKATVQEVLIGPVVTRYELELQPGVKAAKVSNIDTDLARALTFHSIRVAEVIPGKPYIGIEAPNRYRQTVSLREVIESQEFQQAQARLPMALGKDISGKAIVVDLAKMPHLLVAGSTGSGKSVGINSMILSLLFKVTPNEVKFIMIDPKVVELSIYNGIPHLLTEVVTDMKKASNALRWCVNEMERRYQLLSALHVRNIEGYNEKINQATQMNLPIPDPTWRPGDTMDSMPPALEKLNYIVVIVDEFADLMMVAGKQVEELIARLAQKARAVGIHLILATQRPSVDVITGLIKANIPSRIAFTVASKIDSRTILDQGGAEALLGRGDMLYSGQGSSELIRVHGAFMTDEEVLRIAEDWRARGKPHYIADILEDEEDDAQNAKNDLSDELDELFDEVVDYVINTGTTSASSIQRRFRVGFNRAARIVEQMEEQGIVSAPNGSKGREVLARRGDYS